MNSRPLVSTIVAFLNGERFIEEAIESVFAQTYDNWELLLVDDGSTDGSTQIALRCAEQHPGKVHYLEHPGHQNRGKEASRNLGLSHAEGEYVAFLDADDVWLSHALEQQVAVFDSYPEAGMIYGPTQVWYSWTGSTEDSQRDFRTLVGKEGDAKLDTLLEPPTGLLNKLLQPLAPPENLGIPTPCSVLLRREVVKSVGGWKRNFKACSRIKRCT
jgi:glycosyltransferase involved in cell wall biosynthesis